MVGSIHSEELIQFMYDFKKGKFNKLSENVKLENVKLIENENENAPTIWCQKFKMFKDNFKAEVDVVDEIFSLETEVNKCFDECSSIIIHDVKLNAMLTDIDSKVESILDSIKRLKDTFASRFGYPEERIWNRLNQTDPKILAFQLFVNVNEFRGLFDTENSDINQMASKIREIKIDFADNIHEYISMMKIEFKEHKNENKIFIQQVSDKITKFAKKITESITKLQEKAKIHVDHWDRISVTLDEYAKELSAGCQPMMNQSEYGRLISKLNELMKKFVSSSKNLTPDDSAKVKCSNTWLKALLNNKDRVTKANSIVKLLTQILNQLPKNFNANGNVKFFINFAIFYLNSFLMLFQRIGNYPNSFGAIEDKFLSFIGDKSLSLNGYELRVINHSFVSIETIENDKHTAIMNVLNKFSNEQIHEINDLINEFVKQPQKVTFLLKRKLVELCGELALVTRSNTQLLDEQAAALNDILSNLVHASRSQ